MPDAPGGVHLCGSIPLSDTEAVFRLCAARLGSRVRRLPDGETGERLRWVEWQLPRLQAEPDLETRPPTRDQEYLRPPQVRPAPGVDPASVRLGPLGYAAAAAESWRVFSRLRREGVIPPGVRFQVSLPTPVAVTGLFVADQHDAMERAYETRLLSELAEILTIVPAADLAIQWDCAVEFGIFEEVFPCWFGTDQADMGRAVRDRLVRLGDAVPADVELGYHLCYGDREHQHFVEPADTAKLVSVANGVSAGLGRRLDWVHLPVPRGRSDSGYFAPLRSLCTAEETTVYLGLVHATDGVEGGLRRISAARAVVPSFGIATECGMGRRAAQQIPGLLDLHAKLADAL